MELLPSALTAVRDLCHLAEENPMLKLGTLNVRAAGLAKRIDQHPGQPITLTAEELGLVVDIAEAVVNAVVADKPIVASAVLVRIAERAINPITDALGYPGHVR